MLGLVFLCEYGPDREPLSGRPSVLAAGPFGIRYLDLMCFGAGLF